METEKERKGALKKCRGKEGEREKDQSRDDID
jgi:hypothetical protein